MSITERLPLTPRTRTDRLAALCGGLILVAAWLAPASAQAQALSLLPQDQPARMTSPWSLFTTRVTPEPVETAEPATAEPATTEDKPEPAKAAGKATAQDKWKLVKVPLPPIPDRARLVGGAKAVTGKNEPGKTADTAKAGQQEIAVVEPPQPKATGIFALLFTPPPAGAEGENAAGDSDSARPVNTAALAAPVAAEKPRQLAARSTKIDLSDPFRPKNLPGPGEAEDDLDAEETAAGVAKQISSVSIACLKPDLLEMIRKAGEHFGAMPVITSGHRASGRRGSLHRTCEAADFTIPGVETATLAEFLRKMPGAGGVGTYCHTKSVHLDTGEPRDWRYCGFSRRFALRSPVVAASR